MTTTHNFEGIVTIKGLRGARRAAAKSHNASLRASMRPRDAKGRFVVTSERITNAVVAIELEVEAFGEELGLLPAGMTHVDQLEVEGGWINASDDTTHARTDCPKLDGTTFAHADKADGWLCCMCIHVPADANLHGVRVMANVAPETGDRECKVCHEVKSMKKFLTVVDSGFRFRNTMCSKCEVQARDANRAMRNAKKLAAALVRLATAA